MPIQTKESLAAGLKFCPGCQMSKPTSEFHKRSNRSSLRPNCKVCHAKQTATWRQANRERLVEWQREYRRKNRSSHVPSDITRAAARRWKEQHPERVQRQRAAQLAVFRAIRKGLLVRPAQCEQCLKAGYIEAAHTDYSRQLDIRWLCRSCHRIWDRSEPKTLGAAS